MWSRLRKTEKQQYFVLRWELEEESAQVLPCITWFVSAVARSEKRNPLEERGLTLHKLCFKLSRWEFVSWKCSQTGGEMRQTTD